MRVVVVDDDEGVRAFARRALEHAGHSVQTMADGKALLSVPNADMPDVVVTDIFMPDIDGYEVLRGLRRISPDVPIIAISGGTAWMHGHALRVAKHLNAAIVLAKPFTAQQLRTAVAEVARV